MTISYKFDLDGQEFKCPSFDDITQLHNYHDIVSIDCSYNQLTVLPTLPNSLIELYCHNNNLTVLPTLPQRLEYLVCSSNELTILQTLPNSLTLLRCTYNKLTFIPTLPNSLTRLYCQSNILAFFPKFPDSLEYNYYDHNPVDTYIKKKYGGSLDIYHRVNEIFATKLVRWYLDCRENPSFKFCRDRLDREYDALMEEDVGEIMG